LERLKPLERLEPLERASAFTPLNLEPIRQNREEMIQAVMKLRKLNREDATAVYKSLGVIFPAACCAWDSPNLWNFDTPLLAAG